MIENNKSENFSIKDHRCWFSPYFSIDGLTNILSKDHVIFTKTEKHKDIFKYIDIHIMIGDKGTVDYGLARQERYETAQIYEEKYDNKDIILFPLVNILYHYPSITINDINYIPIIVKKDTILNPEIIYDIHDKLIIDRRQKYWDQCYSKYEELYF